MKRKMEHFPAKNPNPVLSVKKDDTVLFSNEAGELLLIEWGIKVGEKLPSHIVDIVQRVIALNIPEKLEVKAGNKIYSVAFHPLPEEECVNIYGFDISEQKELEENLRKSEKEYRNIVETANEGIVILNDECLITYVNEKMATMLEYTKDEIIGKSVRDFTDEDGKTIFEQNIKKRRQGIDESHEFKFIKKDGSPLWTLVNSKALFDMNGKFIGSLSMNTDITERKRVEETLKLTQASIDLAADYILWITPNGKVIYANDAACKSLQYSRDELQGMYVWDFDLIYTKEVWSEHWLDIKKRGSFSFESLHDAKDRREFPIEVSVNYVRSGDMEFNFAYIKDITERKNVEDALIKAHDNLEEKVKERTAELENAYNSLKESEERLSEAQKIAHIGNWDWNLKNGEMYWSDEIHRIFGRTPQKLSSYSEVLTCTHPNDREHVDSAVKRALKGESVAIDHRIVLANGEERIVHAQGETIFDDKNTPIWIRGTVQDITERKEAEEKIRSLASIVESSNDAIGTISLDGIIASWNKGAEQLYGYSTEEILGKHVSILAPLHLDTETMKLIELVKQGEKIRNYETTRLRKDGKIIYVSFTLSPVFDVNGRMTGVSFISRDITENKRIQDKLIESEERLRLAHQAAKIGSFEWNIQTGVNTWTPEMEAMYGLQPGEFGKTEEAWEQLVHPEDRQNAICMVDYAIKTGEPTTLEWRVIWSDGSIHWLTGRWQAYKDTTGNPLRLTGVNIDITEQKEAEELLAKIEVVRKQEIHHRIKNNLQVISSLLDLQAEKFKNRECIKDCPMGCIRNSEVLDAFMESQNRVISMALIHEELYKGGEIDTLNFSSYIEELANSLFQTYMVGIFDISLKLDLAENVFFDMDTAVPLGIIVNEIVSNSLKHAFIGRDNGEIRIKLHREVSGECKKEDYMSPTYVLSVSDNGIGIPENLDIENFDSLGLQLVTTLVDQLDGELELKRDNGTEFVIRFTVTENSNQI